MLYLGEIFINEYFEFKYPSEDGQDHFIRPCVVLHESRDYIYFLPLTHNGTIFKEAKYKLKYKGDSYVSLEWVYKIPSFIATGYTDLKKKEIYPLLKALRFYQTNFCEDIYNYLDIADIIDEAIKMNKPKKITLQKK